MAFPTIPTEGAGRVLASLSTATSNPSTRTFPNLSNLTKNQGDLLIAVCGCYGYASAQSPDNGFSSWGGGFTEFMDRGTVAGGIGAAYKWSTGSESGTFTVTQSNVGGHAAMMLISIPGAHASTVPEGGSFVVGTGASVDPASFDPSGWDAEDTLWISVGAVLETSTSGSWVGMLNPPPDHGNQTYSGMTGDTTGAVEMALAFRQLNASADDVGPWEIDTTNTRNCAAVIAVRPAPAFQSKTLSPALENDAPQNLGITHIHYRTLTPVAENDQPQALVRKKRKTLTAALETDQPQVLSKTKTIHKSLTPVLESDAPQVLSVYHPIHKSLTAVLEADAPQALSITKTIYKSLEAVLETDTSQSLSHRKTKALSAALETEEAQALSYAKPIHKSLATVLESDQASTLARTTHKSLTAALEADTAQALSKTHIHYRTLEPVAEADQALSVSYIQAHAYAIIEALESDAAQVLSVTKTIYKSLVPVSETDAPQALSAKHFRTLTSASEADAPQALSYVKPIHQSITAVPESETAEILSVEKPIHKSLTAALESSAAQALSFLKTIHKTLTAAPELDLAQVLSILHPIRKDLVPVDEIDTAQDLYFTQENIFYILPVEEVEEALALNRIQILRPDSDSVDGEWTNEIGGTELASHVSDQDYGTYIQSPASPSADACRLKLKSGLAPVEGARLLKFRVWKDQPGQTIDLIVSLREGGGDNLGGGTLVNQFTHQNITDAATVEDEVTGNITDYSNLYVELEASEV